MIAAAAAVSWDWLQRFTFSVWWHCSVAECFNISLFPSLVIFAVLCRARIFNKFSATANYFFFLSTCKASPYERLFWPIYFERAVFLLGSFGGIRWKSDSVVGVKWLGRGNNVDKTYAISVALKNPEDLANIWNIVRYMDYANYLGFFLIHFFTVVNDLCVQSCWAQFNSLVIKWDSLPILRC